MMNPIGLVKDLLAARHPHTRDILVGFEGVIRPGEMLRKCQVFARL